MALLRLWRWLKESWTRLNLESRWPDLFTELLPLQRFAVTQALAGNWHEGWEPNRDDVANLIDVIRGTIDYNEYLRRALAIARHRAAGAAT